MRSQACPNDHLRLQTARRSRTPVSSPDVAHRDVSDWIRRSVAIVGIRCEFSSGVAGSGVLIQFSVRKVVCVGACLIYDMGSLRCD